MENRECPPIPRFANRDIYPSEFAILAKKRVEKVNKGKLELAKNAMPSYSGLTSWEEDEFPFSPRPSLIGKYSGKSFR